MQLYHPTLGREITIPDNEDCIAVHLDGGWKPVPETEVEPGHAPEPVVYAPVDDKPKTKPKADKAD